MWRAAFVMALAIACASAAISCGQGDTRPNVVFILVEDQGAHLGRLGTSGLETPRIDALASQGAFFTAAFTPYPVCSAAKASIYTGLWPNTHGLSGNTANFFKPAADLTDTERAHPLQNRSRITSPAPTLVELARDAGYVTAVTHKLHVLPVERFPYELHQRKQGGTEIRELIRRLADDARPFFLMLNMKGSHRPFTGVDGQVEPSTLAALDLPGHLPDTPAVRADWANYLDSIERTDALVGATLDALDVEVAGLQNTIVIFTSDHGPAFQRGKMSLHDLGTRVPLLFAGPGIEAGFESDRPVSLVDIMPTLVDLLGLDAGTEFDGVSHAAQIEGRSAAPERDYVFAQVDHEIQRHDRGMRERSVTDGRFRLIWRDDGRKPRTVNADLWRKQRWGNVTYDETVTHRDEYPDAFRILREIDTGRLKGDAPRLELYDMSQDPDELVNLAWAPEAAEMRARLSRALADWMHSTGDRAAPAIEADLARP